jgi:hypothetical protein
VREDRTRGHTRSDNADTSGESGWITTEVAARAVRVSPRTIRRYIDQGKLEAKPQGEGVRREWLVSVDSLHALRASRTASRTIEQDVSESGRNIEYADSIADVLREMAARLESRAEEAAEFRVRLELTEQAASTVRAELEEERRRREEAERTVEDLRSQLAELEARESDLSTGPRDAPPEGAGGPQEPVEQRPWWRRLLGDRRQM